LKITEEVRDGKKAEEALFSDEKRVLPDTTDRVASGADPTASY
jgi:hypothetical protein